MLPKDLEHHPRHLRRWLALLAGETLHQLVDHHAASGSAVTVITANLADPTGYGRILRGGDDAVEGIVEHKDATPTSSRSRRSTPASTRSTPRSCGALTRSAPTTRRAKYLTDALAIARAAGRQVSAHLIDDLWQTEGVNDRVHSPEWARIAVASPKWMREGVTIVDPDTTWIDADVTIGRDATILRTPSSSARRWSVPIPWSARTPPSMAPRSASGPR